MSVAVPKPEYTEKYQPYFDKPRFGHELSWTFAVLWLWLLAVCLLYAIIWDQRRRCRICLRKLMMPVATGSWNRVLLLGPPRTEYICAYGHGTLIVPEMQISGRESPDWEPNEDIWAELTSLEKKQ